ncbi:sugar phosphate nucleotidyltransferase [Thermus parvatiensis]|uniref:sugar phosphate nucleotidyltransferase n=1 Tax=Thermus parvatiensis TaxID=456163 RepID=UPI001FCF9CCA|nr:sugar phosphate nucleotidyltransferase [Thermus parvatiensis]
MASRATHPLRPPGGTPGAGPRGGWPGSWGKPFVLYLGDNLFQKGIRRFLEAFKPSVSAVIALVRVEDPRQFGVAVLEGNRVVRLLEKPKEPPSDLAVAGVYVFSPRFWSRPGPQALRPGEYEITDAIQASLTGQNGGGRGGEGWWKDTGRHQDLLDANRLLLEELTPKVEGDVVESQLTAGWWWRRGRRWCGAP